MASILRHHLHVEGAADGAGDAEPEERVGSDCIYDVTKKVEHEKILQYLAR